MNWISHKELISNFANNKATLEKSVSMNCFMQIEREVAQMMS